MFAVQAHHPRTRKTKPSSRDRGVKSRGARCRAQLAQNFGISELARHRRQGFELLKLRCRRQQQQEHAVGWLTVNRLEINGFVEPRQYAERFPRLAQARMRY